MKPDDDHPQQPEPARPEATELPPISPLELRDYSNVYSESEARQQRQSMHPCLIVFLVIAGLFVAGILLLFGFCLTRF